MENNTFYHEILIDHNQHPVHKHKLEDANLVLEGVNPSCGDDIILQLKVEDGKITDGAYIGDGCAISRHPQILCWSLSLVSQRTKQCIWQIFSLG